eukprot:8123698-Pyramimonas_sp.AAC.1
MISGDGIHVGRQVRRHGREREGQLVRGEREHSAAEFERLEGQLRARQGGCVHAERGAQRGAAQVHHARPRQLVAGRRLARAPGMNWKIVSTYEPLNRAH